MKSETDSHGFKRSCFRLFGALLTLIALLSLAAGCKPSRTKSFGEDNATPPSTAASSAAGARVALLVGCGAYRADPSLTLDTPVNDMKDLGAKLRGLGFETILAPDPSLEDFYSVLGKFGDRAKDAGIAFFFYSGHGVEYEGQNYLIPVTATLDEPVQLRTQTVNLAEVLKTLDGTNASARLAVLDCCRNNPFKTTKGWLKTKGVREDVLRELGESEIPQSTMICFATGAGRKAAAVLDSESERNSPFTRLLLNELDAPGESIRTIFENVHDQLAKATGGRQAPAVKTDNALSEVFRETVLRAGLAATPTPMNDPALVARIQELERRLAAREAAVAGAPPAFVPGDHEKTIPDGPSEIESKPLAPPPNPKPAMGVTDSTRAPDFFRDYGAYPASHSMPELVKLKPSENPSVEIKAPAEATPAPAFTGVVNSLGQRFIPVGDVDFCIWQTRVKDFEVFAKAVNLKSIGWKLPGFKQEPDHPVVDVTWQEAIDFCKWLTDKEQADGILPPNRIYRLPTDLEWSKAVGLPDEPGMTPADRDMVIAGVYPWGKEWPPPPGAGNYTGEETQSDVAIKGYNDGYAWTSPVGSFKPNQYGLYDMGGNVWQWCMDSWDGVRKGKVLRGASWYNGALKLSLLSSCRIHAAPDSCTDNYGFRIVKAWSAQDQSSHRK